jgi:hypothetical protein
MPNVAMNGAVVWWNDLSGKPGFSFTVKQLYSTQAESDALLHCRKSGGRNCRVGFKFTNGWVAIARAADGSFFAANDRSESNAQSQALKRCQASGKSCEIVVIADNRN